MDIEIKTEKQNPFLERKEIRGELKFTGATPSNKQLKEELAKKIAIEEDRIVVKHIYGRFGNEKAKFEAYAYSTKEKLEKTEPRKKEQKAAEPAKEK